ncbi:MAG: nucleotidyl transferase AbiEii/AbiGii toxin family protein [Candidatus Limnocylindrales bacterium]
MKRGHSYPSPQAFRQALTDKLREASSIGPWTLSQLQRQIAYDRLLERLYLVDDGWVVKGATALLARGIGVRATIDVDIYRERARELAEAELREAASRDIGDWFTFELGPGRAVATDAAVRLPATAYVGTASWASFHVDLVGSDMRMTGQPDNVPPLARVLMPDIEQHGYRAYPLVDHIADKISAIVQRYSGQDRPSTRFKDLVDLVAIVKEVSVSADAQVATLVSEAERRGMPLPATFDVPDRVIWERGYAAEAGRSLLPTAKTLDAALDVVRPFIQPLLSGTAAERWDPERGRWTG